MVQNKIKQYNLTPALFSMLASDGKGRGKLTKGEGEGASCFFDASTSLKRTVVLGLAGAGRNGKWHIKWFKLGY